MNRVFTLIIIIAIIGVVGFLIYKVKMLEKTLEVPMPAPLKIAEVSKKAALIVAFRNFKDEEYFTPKRILQEAGVEITTVSTQSGIAVGADGGETKVNLLLENLNVADFDAIVFIGGPGALERLDNEKSYQVARQAVENNKILAAICISPTILAKAGVLDAKRATVWSSPLDRGAIKILEENGAVFEDKPVVVDGKVVTANGPVAAREFGQALVEMSK